MQLGVFIFATDYSIDISELAVALEDRGFGSLFVPEHTHIPTSRKTAFRRDRELPKEYMHTYDPFVALSFVVGSAGRAVTSSPGGGLCGFIGGNSSPLTRIAISS